MILKQNYFLKVAQLLVVENSTLMNYNFFQNIIVFKNFKKQKLLWTIFLTLHGYIIVISYPLMISIINSV